MMFILQALTLCIFVLETALAHDNTTTDNDKGDAMIRWVSSAPPSNNLEHHLELHVHPYRMSLRMRRPQHPDSPRG
jgi:hypothetical protein